MCSLTTLTSNSYQPFEICLIHKPVGFCFFFLISKSFAISRTSLRKSKTISNKTFIFENFHFHFNFTFFFLEKMCGSIYFAFLLLLFPSIAPCSQQTKLTMISCK